MEIVICGDGPMGRALADELRQAGHAVRLLGRPPDGGHDPSAFQGVEVVHDFSTAGAVASNVAAAIAGGCRRFVIGTTGWSADLQRVEAILSDSGAAAVASPTFSPGATILLALAADAARRLAVVGGYEPFIVEWHRAAKRDRPSGTAAELARRLHTADPDGPRADVASVRAGEAAPGMHLVSFDAPGETLELRLTARSRRCYAAGARLAGDWLAAASRAPGIHGFESVIAELATQRIPDRTTERIPA